MSVSIEEIEDVAGGRQSVSAGLLREQLLSDAHRAYDEREESLGSDTMREVERRVVLSVLDRKWREHLYEMDYLQEGIGLRAMAQRDPLIEYQREGFQLFEAMMEAIKEESVSHLFSVEVQVAPQPAGVGAAPMAVSDLVGGVAAATADRTGAAANDDDADDEGSSAFGTGVRVSGVDHTDGQRAGALSYSAPGEDGRAVVTGDQQPVERRADRRGKKVKRKRR